MGGLERVIHGYHVTARPEDIRVHFDVRTADERDRVGSLAIEVCIKWDGCSDWSAGRWVHFCGQDQARHFGEFLGRLYEWAAELMPENAEYLIEPRGYYTPPAEDGRSARDLIRGMDATLKANGG